MQVDDLSGRQRALYCVKNEGAQPPVLQCVYVLRATHWDDLPFYGPQLMCLLLCFSYFIPVVLLYSTLLPCCTAPLLYSTLLPCCTVPLLLYCTAPYCPVVQHPCCPVVQHPCCPVVQHPFALLYSTLLPCCTDTCMRIVVMNI